MFVIPTSSSQVAALSSRATATTPGWCRRCGTRGLHARWLSWDDPETERADLVILRATWDYIDRLDEFLAWTRRVPEPAERARRGGVEHRQALPGRPRRGGGADRAEPSSSRRAKRWRRSLARWSSNRRSVRDRLARNGSPTPMRRANTPRSCSPTGAPRWCSPTTPASRTARRRWCSSRAASPTRSPRGRILPPPGGGPAFDDSGTYAEESLRPAEPDFELWDVGHAALAAAANHLGIAPAEFLYARVDVIGDSRRSAAARVGVGGAVAGLASARRGRPRQATARVRLGVESALDRLGLGPFSHRRP